MVRATRRRGLPTPSRSRPTPWVSSALARPLRSLVTGSCRLRLPMGALRRYVRLLSKTWWRMLITYVENRVMSRNRLRAKTPAV